MATAKLAYSLRYVKKCDAFNYASMGTAVGTGAIFDGIPIFPHGLYGIIIASGAHIERNVTIFHGVTIGHNNRNAANVPTIGDNVTIYPDAKIVGKVTIGNDVEIGANAVVVKDVPDNSLVVCGENRVIVRKR